MTAFYVVKCDGHYYNFKKKENALNLASAILRDGKACTMWRQDDDARAKGFRFFDYQYE